MMIPAQDALRCERVGLIETGGARIVALRYLKDSSTAGTPTEHPMFEPPEPIEAFCDPFPMMYCVENEETLVFETAMTEPMEPLSNRAVEYASYVHESMENGEWVDEITEYDSTDISDKEESLLSGLMGAGTDMPPRLYRALFREAERVIQDGPRSGPLADSLTWEGNPEWHNFSLLPKMESVDSWDLTLHMFEDEDDEGNSVIANSLWLRYEEKEGEVRECPMFSYQSNTAGFSVASPDVEYGTNDCNTPSVELVEALLAGERDDRSLLQVSQEEIENTRTKQYLEAWLDRET